MGECCGEKWSLKENREYQGAVDGVCNYEQDHRVSHTEKGVIEKGLKRGKKTV